MPIQQNLWVASGTGSYPQILLKRPKRRALMDELFEQINGQKLMMPDGSGREIRIKLGPKEGSVLASKISQFGDNY